MELSRSSAMNVAEPVISAIPSQPTEIVEQNTDALFSTLYAQLHSLARRELARKIAPASLSVTTLLHEAYIDMSQRVGTVFPNMSFLSRQPRSIAVWHPRGTLRTEAWRWFLVDQDAPQEVKDLLRHYYMRYSGPGGLTEQDDMENWNYASAASKGVIARRYPYNYQMGMGAEGTHPDVPGVVTVGIS